MMYAHLVLSAVAALVNDKDLGPKDGGPKDISLLLGRRLLVAKRECISVRI